MTRKPRWTHTAVLTGSALVGPSQDVTLLPAGETVDLWQDPADQSGHLISIRKGDKTGATPLTQLSNIQAKEGN